MRKYCTFNVYVLEPAFLFEMFPKDSIPDSILFQNFDLFFSEKALSPPTIYRCFAKLEDGVSYAPNKSLRRREGLEVLNE